MLKPTIDECRMLADLERRMDSGQQAYVIVFGHRMAMEPLIMEEFGLTNGQTISQTIATAIIEARIAGLKALKALN